MLRWSARILAAVLVLSLGYGWIVQGVDSGAMPGWGGTLRPVFSAEAVRAGYTYYESESPLGRAGMVRRHTGEEPIAWEADMPRPMTAQEFYGGRVRERLDDRLRDAIGVASETATVETIGWRWPVWSRAFRVGVPGGGPARMDGFVSLGRAGVMTRPVWPGFLVSVMVVAAGLWAAECGARTAVRRVRRMRTPYGHCPACGYDLAGIDGAVCPECGVSQAEGGRA
jgi:hypothetical protein